MKEKVLIVDDHKNNIRLLQDILHDEGYATFVAYDGEEAIEKAFDIKPDLVLLDIMMPKLDGYSVCETLQKSSETADIPIIMVTARVESSALKKAMEVGAYDYIKKPIDEVEVVARVASAIKHKNNIVSLKKKSLRDGLTGVCNHSACKEIVEKELKDNSKTKLSFVMLDIDYFKNINDQYGHVVGDEILRQLSSVIKDVVGDNAKLGRYGGDEFYIISSVNSYAETEELCKKIRTKIESYTFKTSDGDLKVTVSIGYTCADKDEISDIVGIIKEADKALYQAKETGKNNVVNYS